MLYQHTLCHFIQVQHVATSTVPEDDNEEMAVVWSETETINEYTAHETPMAIEPLLNLRRIATNKQNYKRCSELSLRLVQAYLSASDDDNDDNDNDDSDSKFHDVMKN